MDSILIKSISIVTLRILSLGFLIINSAIASPPEIEIEVYPSRVPKIKTTGLLSQCDVTTTKLSSEESPNRKVTCQVSSIKELLQETEALLLHRYLSETEQSILIPPVIPSKGIWAKYLLREKTEQLRKTLSKHANNGSLHASVLLAIHFLSGMFTYDPARAGVLLRQIKRRVTSCQKEKEWMHEFLSERSELIESCDAYKTFSTACSVFGIIPDPTPEHAPELTHVEREGQNFSLIPDCGNGYSLIAQNLGGRSILSPAAMAFEAEKKDELRGHLGTILSLLSNITSPELHIMQSSEYTAIKLTAPPTEAFNVYNSWLLYYLGCYLEKSGIHIEINYDRKFMDGIVTALKKAQIPFNEINGIAVTADPKVVFKSAFMLSRRCPAALAKFYSRFARDQLKRDTCNTSEKLNIFSIPETMNDNFEPFCEYIGQLDINIAMNIAEVFQRIQHYHHAEPIYRIFARRCVPIACHRLAWLQDQGKTDARPEEVASGYLCAIQGGYTKAAGRLKTYIAEKHPELIRFREDAQEFLREKAEQNADTEKMLKDLDD